MQNYQGNSGDYMRRGNHNRSNRANCCQQVVSTPSCVYDNSFSQAENKDELSEMVIAMAYVPWQSWKRILCPEQALRTGTIFEELCKPFCGMGGCRS